MTLTGRSSLYKVKQLVPKWMLLAANVTLFNCEYCLQSQIICHMKTEVALCLKYQYFVSYVDENNTDYDI